MMTTISQFKGLKDTLGFLRQENNDNDNRSTNDDDKNDNIDNNSNKIQLTQAHCPPS